MFRSIPVAVPVVDCMATNSEVCYYACFIRYESPHALGMAAIM